jgi:hypothetical protein
MYWALWSIGLAIFGIVSKFRPAQGASIGSVEQLGDGIGRGIAAPGDHHMRVNTDSLRRHPLSAAVEQGRRAAKKESGVAKVLTARRSLPRSAAASPKARRGCALK